MISDNCWKYDQDLYITLLTWSVGFTDYLSFSACPHMIQWYKTGSKIQNG